MRFVMISWIDPADAAAFEVLPATEQKADADRYRAWFRIHGGRVVSAEELGYPTNVRSLRPGGGDAQPRVSNGPAIETGHFIGALLVIEAEDMEEAVRVAADWPTLATQPRSVVQVHEVYERA
jgi:hypothetical protein